MRVSASNRWRQRKQTAWRIAARIWRNNGGGNHQAKSQRVNIIAKIAARQAAGSGMALGKTAWQACAAAGGM